MGVVKGGPRPQKIKTSGDENHLCGASLRESQKIHHAHGIDYHHMHQWAWGWYPRLQRHVS